MKNYSKEAKLKIYKKMLDFAIEDRTCSLIYDFPLHGLCHLLNRVTGSYELKINDFPELWALKPKNKSAGVHWWSRKATNMTRIKKLREIIKQMESK